MPSSDAKAEQKANALDKEGTDPSELAESAAGVALKGSR